MAAYSSVQETANGTNGSHTSIDQAEIEQRPETKEDRAMRRFLEDPERSLKIFFTSYFIDKGLMWYVAFYPILAYSLTIFQEGESMRRRP